ncbi:MAG: hypothetical protein ACLVCI_05320 [Varibaculum timonense]
MGVGDVSSSINICPAAAAGDQFPNLFTLGISTCAAKVSIANDFPCQFSGYHCGSA